MVPPDFYRSVYPISTKGTGYTNLITHTKTEMIYTKNVRAKVSMDFT